MSSLIPYHSYLMNFKSILPGLLLGLSLVSPVQAQEQNPTNHCKLVVNGTVLMNGSCSVKKDPDGMGLNFTDNKYKVGCTVPGTSCYGYQQMTIARGVFGQMGTYNGVTNLYHNNGTMRSAQSLPITVSTESINGCHVSNDKMSYLCIR